MNSITAPSEYHINVDHNDEIALDLLAQHTTYSRQGIKQAMTKGAVWLSHGTQTTRLRRAKKNLNKGDQLHLYYDEGILATEPPKPTLIADEEGYSIWYKPYGLLSQGSKWGDHCTINRWIEQHQKPQRPAIIVHRLDRAATGLMIIAHQKRIAAAFSRIFQQRAISKHYQAIVQGHFPVAEKALCIDQALDDRPAISHVTALGYDREKNQSLVKVVIETGRKHQIRQHLASIGFPIVGDRLYGSQQQEYEQDLQLTACYLAFECPVDHQQKKFRLAAHLCPCF
ncbi:MAG: RNA pseudouridine synthase [Gammaproteobacteria bacterium]|nr:RNA pseudouridine synthase [Gammaproteobacteria bacterium]